MKPTRIIFFTWLAWTLIVLGFQSWATARLDVKYPDRALPWTTFWTQEGYQAGQAYLSEPFMNNQVAWDSEYYLAIAIGGYDDPRSPHLTPTGVTTTVTDHNLVKSGTTFDQYVSLSYAFFPFYPILIRLFALPLQLLGLNPIATATLAGVLVSALGALAGMLALYDISRDTLGEDGALRAVFYLIIFPTGFYLVQVYTEGLFVGLAFGCLAMVKRKYWLAAALLAAAASLTRAVGVILVIPMVIGWFRTGEWLDLDLEWRQIFHEGVPWRFLYHALLAISPLIVFLIWKFSYYGLIFDYVQAENYGRGFLQLGAAFAIWANAFRSMVSGLEPQHTAYYLTEFLGLCLGLAACISLFRTHPEIAWFSLAVVVFSWGSGPAQGMHRYILAAPAVFIALARWGRHPVFDRAWTILSLLLMGTLAMIYAFDMWVA
jgi:hypothetical protein